MRLSIILLKVSDSFIDKTNITRRYLRRMSDAAKHVRYEVLKCFRQSHIKENRQDRCCTIIIY